MKTYPILLSVLIFHLTTYSQSRPAESKTINFGVRAALANSNLYGSKNYVSYPSGNIFNLNKAKFLTSYSAGVWAGYSLSHQLSLVAEINLTEKGQRNILKGVFINSHEYKITFKPKLTYLGVPITAQYNFKDLGSLGVYAGLEPSFLLSAKQVISGDFDTGTTNVKSDFETFDLGIVAGVNYVLVRGLMVDFRFVNGVRDISPPRESTFVSNKSIQLGLKMYLSK